MGLSADAKKELTEAIRIVREDKFEAHARGVLSGYVPKPADPPANPGTDPKGDPNNPPPKPPDPANDPPTTKKGGYWGELLDD